MIIFDEENAVARDVMRKTLYKHEILKNVNLDVFHEVYNNVMRSVRNRVYHEVCEEIYAELWQKVE